MTTKASVLKSIRNKCLKEDEGRVIAGMTGIILREDVYEGAWRGRSRDRFTACHELAHYLLHRTVTLARARDNSHKIYADSEWQADTFAGTLLMSARHLRLFSGPEDASNACKMSEAAARVMWSKYQVEGRIDATTA